MLVNPHIASISLANSPWLPAVIAGVFIGLVLVVLTYRKLNELSFGKRLAAVTLKTTGLILLGLCLLELEWVKQTPKKGSNLVAMVCDDSRSLTISEKASDSSRGEAVGKLLTNAEVKGAQSFLNELESQFRIRKYKAGRRVQSISSFAELDFSSRSSQLNLGLADLSKRFDGQPLAATVVFTDGNYTDDWKVSDPTFPSPVYFVKIGKDLPGTDLAVKNVTVSESAYEDSPVSVQANISARGMKGQQATVTLVRQSDGAEVQRQTVGFADNVDSKPIRFSFRPIKSGVSFYQVNVEAVNETKEATFDNNQRLITVKQNTGPHRILYVSGRPNWEFKYFRRALRQDASLRLSALQRIAKREPKFQWRGRTGEGSNPLFRGFGREDETEEYDQPVLIRLYVESDQELANGFPLEAEDLFHYKSIVIDDLEADFFSPDQQELLEQFVSKRGGGMLFLGGAESFGEGGYRDSLLQSVLPVHLPGGEEPAEDDRRVRVDLTREGMLEFWLRLRKQEATERQRLQNMPDFQSVNQVRSLKPGASLYATVRDQDSGVTLPALSVHRYGAGRVAALTVGDIWKWGFLEPGQALDRDKMWRQLMRHLTVDVPERHSLEVKAGGVASGERRIEVRLKDRKFDSQFNAKVKLVVTDPKGEQYDFPASPQDSDPGLYVGKFLPNHDGGFRVSASVEPMDDGDLQWDDKATGWTMNSNAAEFASLGINQTWMEKIAEATNGAVLEMDEVDRLPDLIKKNEVPEIEIQTTPIWHTPWFFLLALMCLIGEWAIRRNSGYA